MDNNCSLLNSQNSIPVLSGGTFGNSFLIHSHYLRTPFTCTMYIYYSTNSYHVKYSFLNSRHKVRATFKVAPSVVYGGDPCPFVKPCV